MLTQPLTLLQKGQALATQSGTYVPRGRPAQLPSGSRNDRGLRMQQPGWEEQREQLNRLPQGFEPGALTDQSPSGPARTATANDGELRQQQLYHAMRSAFQHARFPSLSTTAVTEGGEQQRQRWIAAREQVLQGRYDQRDHCAVAWQAAVDDVVRRFLAQARLSWNDLCQVDLRGICRQAVQSVYGLTIENETAPARPSVAREPLVPIQEDLVERETAPSTRPTFADVPVDQEQIPLQQVDRIVNEYMERLRQHPHPSMLMGAAPVVAAVAPDYDAAAEHDLCSEDEHSDDGAVALSLQAMDVSARQALAADDPVLLQRQKLIAKHRPRAIVRRRLMALVDTDVTAIRIGNVPVSLVLLDSGCDWFSVREDKAIAAGYTYSTKGVTVQGSWRAAHSSPWTSPSTPRLTGR